MDRRVENWTLDQLHRERARISFPEYQRQPNLWSTDKKNLLIDSILRDIDIPKLYFNRTPDGNYEVVDGQQRLWALWEFLDGAYAYKAHGTSQRFPEMTRSERDRIRKYRLQVVVFRDANDEYLRETFLRLQLGLLLITGERLNATTGAMKELVFTRLAKHPFVRALGIPARRFSKEALAAQICINSFSKAKVGSFSRTRYEDLVQFFKEYADPRGQDLKFFRERSTEIIGTMDDLETCLGVRTRELRNRSYILSIYLLFEQLRSQGKIGAEKERRRFSQFVFDLWRRLREEIGAGINRKNRELYAFETLVSSAPGEKYQIERRHERLVDYYDHFVGTGKIKGDK